MMLLIVLFIVGYLLFSEGRKSIEPSGNLSGSDAGVEQRVNESLNKYQEGLEQGMQDAGTGQ